MSQIAIIAGAGHLPAAVAAQLDSPLVCALEGFAPEALVPDLVFRVERLVPFLRALSDRGVERVIFAGAVSRPRLDPSLFDMGTAQMVPRLLAAMQGGDDATLRAVIDIFEQAGFEVVGVPDVAPDLFLAPGVYGVTLSGSEGGETVSAVTVSEADQADAARAAAIVAALGAVDVGQGAVVAQGLCLAVETLPGTDQMLDFVAKTARRPNPAGARGVFYKSAKPGQDRRIDLPTIGLETLTRAHAAGLSGIAFPASDVIVLDMKNVLQQAEKLGLFLWAQP
ncbi:MAG: UDP-2,3-diacylglucosamine diphosphatase LpxI [Gemmobacter sp.]|uniref:LpxI family protein n=1 Tax=Gemmobacter sp. TaxID=1898957 RepID=UPI001A58D56F|nr:UDP-2,3-diacylglucosamine diphosphatase LpxI [Gemmobacter sp.]MBL8563383.1 UDP-2,3-diacylglucosamine diphosphatase LpxI [Gemmobacter sp.]